MENRLKNLKKSMTNTSFRELEFTENHRLDVHKRIRQEEEDEDAILVAILQLLSEEKSGYDVAKQLRGRGIEKFEDNEGLLYTMLHTLEQKQYLSVRWIEESIKLYHITKKGKRVVEKLEKSKDVSRLRKFKEVSD
ncbi:PadR family transcriptional regulator [Guptibacillus algicola]|uniref:PadR family transcriptional regulator n=1 Tax=Guptibacillus algicola TaxID=225844 RepID=UPI001CD3EA23|nr:PadR family transcriptional regulator [Alkalihalobacillus algicola]MCA0987250.1 PadR family transcriptional regulator [Alkalihalobacillus algicola]